MACLLEGSSCKVPEVTCERGICRSVVLNPNLSDVGAGGSECGSAVAVAVG